MKPRIPLVRDGYKFILPLFCLFLLALILGYAGTASVLFLLTAFVTFFFRDPERPEPKDDTLVLSPADGKVMEVVRDFRDEWSGGKFTRVTIFLSVFNVHVNRSPHKGRVSRFQYVPGRFLAAFRKNASEVNEQNRILIEDGDLAFVVKQIAGLIARRVVCWPGVGDRLESGERLGLIRFGSRVDLLVPPSVQMRVGPGDRVVGGKTVVGVLSK